MARERRNWPKAGRWDRRLWAGWMPNGMGQVKPNHYGEMWRTFKENWRRPFYALRILRKGVCDGCALGVAGLYDETMKGVHLCTVRLSLLKLNTAKAFDPALLEDVSTLKGKSASDLRDLGRIPAPMVRHAGEKGFRVVSWDEAIPALGGHFRSTAPERMGFYFTSRGLTNENYYIGQKVARFLGTNHVDNSSRICHAPSTTAMKRTLGVAASTCSYTDWIGTDLLVFFGSDVPNNQPVTTKYLFYAKKAGTKVFVVNPYKEPGFERYWVPSVMESALFGTKLTDRFFSVHTGGDTAFVYGVAKHLLEIGGVDAEFLGSKTAGFEEWKQRVEATSWEVIEDQSGSSKEDMVAFAEAYAKSRHAVFVWSMGITQHATGVDNVTALVNLALLRGNVGREFAGVMPIRGHSGVQGSAEMGCVPNGLPGNDPVDAEHATKWSRAWGFPVPSTPGRFAVDTVDACHDGLVDLLWSVGGNYLDTLPEPAYVREALLRVPVRVHQDIVLTPQMLLDANDTVWILPATTRYEQPGGGTETSTERRVYFSPEIPGPRVKEARTEWWVLTEAAAHAFPDRAHLIRVKKPEAIREEIERLVPMYHGIAALKTTGDSFQWGGRHLCAGGVFPTKDGKARIWNVPLVRRDLPKGAFWVSTRRGKQFNSMVQREVDPLNDARREDVLMNLEDAKDLGFGEGDTIRLTSEVGSLVGRVKMAPIRRRNLQVHWPEGNVLVRRGVVDPGCGIPDYNAVVRLERFVEVPPQ